MRVKEKAALAASLLLSQCPVALAAGSATVEERGVYSGTGRACAGELKITADRISWRTPFSACASTPFDVTDRQAATGALQVVYALRHPGPGCRYPVLRLTHKGEGAQLGWYVTGFPTLDALNANDVDGQLACYLVK